MTQPVSFLLLSCSQRKRSTPELLPALERYNGPQFQVVRKFFRTHPELQATIDVAILSARFGIIPPNELIPEYDQRITRERAIEINTNVLVTLRQYTQRKMYQRFCVSIGQDYLYAIEGVEALLPADCEVTYLRGSQGKRLSHLSRWLYGNQPGDEKQRSPGTGYARIRGVEIHLSPEQVLSQARLALADQPASFPPPQAWYVAIDDVHVGPKWLVSQITGLPVHAFNTTDARRVLAALGVEVHSL